MKRMLILCALTFSFHFCSAQTLEEWTQQQQTKIKRLLEQIIANKVYIDYAKKGYKIVSSGLHTIRDIKNADFKLHLGFIDSLKVVNPNVKDWIKVSAIIVLQQRIMKTGKQALDAARQSGQFSSEEIRYCKNVVDNLLTECLKVIDELLLVITSGVTAMSDGERIKRIEKIYLDMQDKSSFAVAFSNDISVLAIQRLAERTELNYSKLLNK
jgi:hypothetical protein